MIVTSAPYLPMVQSILEVWLKKQTEPAVDWNKTNSKFCPHDSHQKKYHATRAIAHTKPGSFIVYKYVDEPHGIA